MIYRKLTETDDYSFGRNEQDFISGAEAVAQAVYTNLKLLRGEWWENVENGLPLFEEIIGESGTEEGKATVDTIVSDRILSTEGVQEIAEYESSFAARRYTARAVINTIYGETAVEVTY